MSTRKIVTLFVRVVAAGVVALIALSLVTVIYNNTGIHVPNRTGATDYKWVSHQYKSIMREGFSWFFMDKEGFNNGEYTRPQSLDILIMGSSHMEGVGVGVKDTVSSQLRILLPQFSLYNIGVAGHTIYHCAKNLDNAIEEYKPIKYVIIETDTVKLENDSIEAVIEHQFPSIPSYNSGVLYIIQKYCPAIKEIYKQLSDWKNMNVTNRYEDVLENDNTDRNSICYDEFLAYMKTKCGEAQLIIMYHPPYHIGKNGDLVFDESIELVGAFASSCIDKGIIFVDMTETFIEQYKQSYTLAHGFINTAVSYGHLNKNGHFAIAQQLAEVIKKDQQQ